MKKILFGYQYFTAGSIVIFLLVTFTGFSQNIAKQASKNSYELFLSLRSRQTPTKQELKKHNNSYCKYQFTYRTLHFENLSNELNFKEYQGIIVKRSKILWKIVPRNFYCPYPLMTPSYLFAINCKTLKNYSEKNFTAKKIYEDNYGVITKDTLEKWKKTEDKSLIYEFNEVFGEVTYAGKDLLIYAFEEYGYYGGAATYNDSGFETYYYDNNYKPDFIISIKPDFKYLNFGECGLIRNKGQWILRQRSHFWIHGTQYADETIGGKLDNKVIGFDKLPMNWNLIKKQFPNAVDAFSSPDFNFLFIVTKKDLSIYKYDKTHFVKSPLKTIALNNTECVVGINWYKK